MKHANIRLVTNISKAEAKKERRCVNKQKQTNNNDEKKKHTHIHTFAEVRFEPLSSFLICRRNIVITCKQCITLCGS